MATIEDLGYRSISDMSHDEAIEHLRQIRLSRRMPVKREVSKKTASPKKPAPKLTKDMAKELLGMIGDE